MNAKRNKTGQAETAIVEDVTAVQETPECSASGWGAVLAGVAVVIGTAWLLTVLGAAMGMSVIDLTDAEVLGSGFSIGSAIWMLLTGLVAFFVGAWVTGRLAGRPWKTVGVLHGLTLWSVAMLIMVVLSYWGVSNLLGAGVSAVKTTTGAVTGTLQAGGSVSALGGQGLAQAGKTVADSALVDSVMATLKRRATRRIAESAGSGVTTGDVQEAVADLDANTLSTVATELIDGDTQGAEAALSRETKLSREQISALVEGVRQQISESTALETVQDRIDQAYRQAAQQIGDYAGPALTQSEARRALRQIDADLLRQLATHLITGDIDRTKDILAANTTLTDQEINVIVDEAREDVQEQVDAFQEQMVETAEVAAGYTQAALWSVFFCSVLGLGAAMAGGALGSSQVRRARVTTVQRARDV